MLGLVAASRRVSAPGSLTRRASWASLGFVIAEALIGAGLVLFGWVGQDPSLGRALTASLHPVNTPLLLAALTITARVASLPDKAALRWSQRWLAGIGAGLAAVAVLGASGALTALGDTLFPALSLAEGLAADASPAANALVRLRVVHPVLAVLAGGYLLALAGAFRPGGGQPARLARALAAIVLVQWAVGALNVILLAPVGLQIVHLLLADLAWITLVLLALAIGEQETARPGRMASAHLGA